MDAATFLKRGKPSEVIGTVGHSEHLTVPLAEDAQRGVTTPVARVVPDDVVLLSDSQDLPNSRPSSASGASEPVSEQDSPLDTVFRDMTPSGIVVEYEAKPKRLYRVNGVEVPSVTTVLDCLAKNGLSWWGMKGGVGGVLELFDRSKLSTILDWPSSDQIVVLTEGKDIATVDNVTALLTAEKLTVNHQLTKAGDRGTNVHSALEAWAKSGGEFFPTPAEFPDEERPYVDGLLNWLQVGDGWIRPALYEVMVGSAEHGFAGRYDLVVEIGEPLTFISKAYKKRESKKIVVGPGRYLIDLKTSSGVYTSHFRQLAAYELASVESGYPKTDGQFVLHVTKDGQYEFVPSKATANDFLTVLEVWKSEQGLK